ncbi:MAG: hypothetical protein PHH54_01315 [Candidatus Nanoarchaeia archaeon]|nr:hypothetical protein [Candidatus Nanoarchaeia archaeon]MDD5740602.1 hypothetical protein [Candidatus Nanoarchaeia archaeon]
MSLDDVETKEEDKEIEEARHFSNLVWRNKKKEALEYYNKLGPKAQHYIKSHKFYSLDLKAASFRG